jgi:hypothetical protein
MEWTLAFWVLVATQDLFFSISFMKIYGCLMNHGFLVMWTRGGRLA